MMKQILLASILILTTTRLFAGEILMKENRIWEMAENDKWQENALKEVNHELDRHTVPVWAKDVSSIMPGWGFELHCKRWVEGLDAVLYSLRDGCCYRTPFGRYGDNSAASLNNIEKMATAVESWIKGEKTKDKFTKSVHDILGEKEKDRIETAKCFVEITRTYVVEQGPTEKFNALGAKWRKQTDSNDLLKLIFSGEGLDRGLCDGGGFWAEERLLLILRVIGGKQTDVKDLLGSCNYQLRHVFRDDRERMMITKGYLIGIAGYLNGTSIADIRKEWPDLAGYAIKAYTCLANSKLNEKDKRAIAKKLFITAKYWYVRALIFSVKNELKKDDKLLPEIRR